MVPKESKSTLGSIYIGGGKREEGGVARVREGGSGEEGRVTGGRSEGGDRATLREGYIIIVRLGIRGLK